MIVLPAAYNEEVRTTLLDKRLQEVLLKIDGAANREQVRLAGSAEGVVGLAIGSSAHWYLLCLLCVCSTV